MLRICSGFGFAYSPHDRKYVPGGHLVRFHLFVRYTGVAFNCVGKVYSYRAHPRVVYTVYTRNSVHSGLSPIWGSTHISAVI